jgi:CHRD domain-containing protein
MKRQWLASAVVGAAALIGCGGGGHTETTLRATLSPADEVPSCSGAAPAATGRGTVIVDDAKVTVSNLTFSGLSGAATMAHIHFGPPGATGPVVLGFGQRPASPYSGSFSAADYHGVPDGPADFAALVAAIKSGQTYINVHTDACGGGEIRGQLTLE